MVFLSEQVRGFWNAEAGDIGVLENATSEADLYKEFRAQRNRTQGYILEIGIGNGADGVMFALNGGYYNSLREGWAYLLARNFVHHCTDVPEYPVARALSKRGVRRLSAKFSDVEMKAWHFPLKKYRGRIPFMVEKWLAGRLCWYLFICADKSQTASRVDCTPCLQ